MRTETNDKQHDSKHEHELEVGDTSHPPAAYSDNEHQHGLEPCKTTAAPSVNPHLVGVFGKIAVKAKKAPTKSREQTVARIRTLAPMIVAKHNAKFVAAATIQAELAAETGTHFNANFLGDCLGGHGLNLPRVNKRAKVRYALHMVDSSDEEKAEVQAALEALTLEERAALIVA